MPSVQVSASARRGGGTLGAVGRCVGRCPQGDTLGAVGPGVGRMRQRSVELIHAIDAVMLYIITLYIIKKQKISY